jgi:hypothetical protein
MALCLMTTFAFSQRIVIFLDNVPNNTPSVSKATLRYDKDFAYSLTFDDGSIDAYTCGLPALQGGFVAGNNTTYSALNFTDGCGNALPFRGGIAWNAASAIGQDNHTGNVPSMMTWTQLDDLYDKGWDVFNHGYTHRSRWLGAMTASDYVYEITQNPIETRNKTRNRIETPLFVVPSGDTYYQDIAYAQGQKIVFDQTANTTGIGGFNVANDVNFAGQYLHRMEIDNQITTGADQVGNVASRAAAGERIWYNEFTHHIDNFGASVGLNFFQFRAHVERIANNWGKNGSDKIWVAPLQEVSEYLAMRQNVTYTATLNGNQLTIDFNMANVPAGLRRKPITLVVNSSATFSRVDGSQGIQMTYNGTGAKKIINLDLANATSVVTDPCTTDVTPPTFANCPQNINLTTTANSTQAFWTTPTANDNCGVPSVSSNFSSGSTFPIGTTAVNYTATDAKGNRTTCSFNIIVTQTVVNPCANDLTPPTISNCPQNISLTTSGTTAVANWTAPTASDNCSTPSVSSTFSSGSTFPVGSTTVTYTATDARNNRSTCSFRVVVTQIIANPCANDVIAPTISNCPQNLNLTTSGNLAVATWTEPTVTDNCSTPSVSSTYTSGSSFPIGTMTVVYTAKDAFSNTSTCSFTVTVSPASGNPCANDVIAPVFQTCPQDIVLTTTNFSAVARWTTPTVTDNCTANPVLTSNYANGGTYPVGTTPIVYAASDDKFNRSTCSFNVIISRNNTNPCTTDATPPVLRNCPINQTLTTTASTAIATWTNPTATDNCTTSPTISSNLPSGYAFPIGTTTVTYAATDAKGNRSTCNFTINVQSIVVGDICASNAETPWQEWISRVQFNTINNVSEKTRSDRFIVGYSDWRDVPTTVNQNKTYPLSITASESYSVGTIMLYYRAWIDFNGNGFFDTNEKVLEVTNNGKIVATQSVKIPTTSITGAVRMRVTMKKGSYPLACEVFPNGEVEDYTINIVSQFAANNLAQQTPTQLIPIVISDITPNPTASDVFIKLESLNNRTVQFDFYNTIGERVKSEKHDVTKGTNTIGFDVSDAPQGVYFIRTDVGLGQNVPVKFIKM